MKYSPTPTKYSAGGFTIATTTGRGGCGGGSPILISSMYGMQLSDPSVVLNYKPNLDYGDTVCKNGECYPTQYDIRMILKLEIGDRLIQENELKSYPDAMPITITYIDSKRTVHQILMEVGEILKLNHPDLSDLKKEYATAVERWQYKKDRESYAYVEKIRKALKETLTIQEIFEKQLEIDKLAKEDSSPKITFLNYLLEKYSVYDIEDILIYVNKKPSLTYAKNKMLTHEQWDRVAGDINSFLEARKYEVILVNGKTVPKFGYYDPNDIVKPIIQ